MSICPDCPPPGGEPTRASMPATAGWAMRGLLTYGGSALVSLLILVGVMRLWQANLATPLHYTGDGIYYQAIVKGIIENGWYLHNDRLGQPGGLDLREFPISDGWFHYLVVKLLGLAIPNHAIVFNVFYLLTFPLATLSALFVLRRLGVAPLVAATAALLFAFLPYHLLRLGHLFLAAYYFIPLTVLLIVRVYQGQVPWGRGRFGGTLAVLAVAVLTGLGGVYYALFACFLLAVAGAARAVAMRTCAPLLSAGALVGVVFAALLVTLAPSLHYRHTHPTHPNRSCRHAFEAEYYGLKISQLTLPIVGHRVRRLREITARYAATAPLVNENVVAALGLVGTFGFFLLVGRLLLSRRQGGKTADALALLTVAAVLLATVGGLGSLLAYLGSPWVRAYNRISIYIGFFALAAVALLLEKARQRWARTPPRRWVFAGLLVVLLAGGVLDQTTAGMVPPYETLSAEYASDADLAQRLEETVPPESFVFELPYGWFPEAAPKVGFADIDLVRPYLHTRTLRWSYGSLPGHRGDLWGRATAELPPRQLVDRLTEKGAAGIYLDRRGYKDRAAALEADLTRLLGPPVLTSQNGNQVFFTLAGRPARVAGIPVR